MLRTGRVSDPDALITLLEEFAAEPRKVAELTDEQRRRLMIAAGQLSRPDRYTRKALRKGLNRKAELATKAADRAILDGTGIRALRKLPIFTSLGAIPALPPGEQIDDPAVTDDAPDGGAWAEAEARRDDDAAPRRVARARNCYVCKADFHDLHWFYDQMCPACADENWAKRNQSADLRGRVALVTGGRVKIGAQIAQKLLRAGAEVIVVTRFPVDAARRLAAEPDGDELATRAHVFGCDLRHTPSVEALCAHVRAGWSRLDVLINNACQTVRRPAGFYGHLMAAEREPLAALPAAAQSLLRSHEAAAPRRGGARARRHGVARGAETLRAHDAPELSQKVLLDEDLVRSEAIFPHGHLDQDLQQIDLRKINTWRLPLAEVATIELLEVQLVNAVAPFVLNARLKPL
jgi:hypothetical protein